MKIIVTEEQLKGVISEVLTKRKDPFSIEGTQHMIYDSKKNPNIVFKVGHPYFVDKWLGVFKKYPEYFPRIYRVGILKDRHDYKYVEMDKMNTSRVKDEWRLMTQSFTDIGLLDEDNYEDVGIIFRNCIVDEDYDNNVMQRVHKMDKGVYNLFIKWLNFLHRLNSLVEPIKGNMLDIHDGNFGYDKKGNIKCFDI
jgi:hypothetical protein